MATKSGTPPADDPSRSPPKKPGISTVSFELSEAEIEDLRQSKRRIDDYAQRALTGWAAKPVE